MNTRDLSLNVRYVQKKFDTQNGKYKCERNHEEKQYICDKCDKVFVYECHLRQHNRVHTKKGLYPCLNCNRKFTTYNSMRQHEDTHQSKGHFNCNFCDHKTNSKYLLDQHVKGKHGRGIKAPCGYRLNWHSQIKGHMKKCMQVATNISKFIYRLFFNYV